MTAPEAVPAVLAVEVLEGGQAARLSIEGGRVVFLSPDMTPRASFLPITAHGFAVLLEDWKKEGGPAYRVPASVFDAVARFFDGQRPAPALKKTPLPFAKGASPDHLPRVVSVEALPEGAARLHLASGEALEVPPAAASCFSPEGYAPSLLTFTASPLAGSYLVPDALRLPVMAALGYAQNEEGGQP